MPATKRCSKNFHAFELEVVFEQLLIQEKHGESSQYRYDMAQSCVPEQYKYLLIIFLLVPDDFCGTNPYFLPTLLIPDEP